MAHAALSEVIARAQAQGSLRPDVGIDDIPLLLMANAGVVSATFGTAPHAWRRVPAITLDGLRATGSAPLPPPPSRRQLLRAMIRAAQGPETTVRAELA